MTAEVTAVPLIAIVPLLVMLAPLIVLVFCSMLRVPSTTNGAAMVSAFRVKLAPVSMNRAHWMLWPAPY